MDSLRGNYGSLAESGYDPADDDSGPQTPPAAIGQDERRMQVRAYNHWASLLEDRNFPAIEDLEPENLPDFGPYSVLLDFSTGIENPGISFLGDKLAQECDCGEEELTTLADVPARSLLTRITDHYMQILANQAPIGFEAEFVNQRGATIAYRGILLPFSSDDDTIDFIYGVINWKELADAQHSDELLLEIDQVLEPKAKAPALDADTPLTDWADGPGAEPANDVADFAAEETDVQDYPTEEFPAPGFAAEHADDVPAYRADEEGDEDENGDDDEDGDEDGSIPLPSFGMDDEDDDEPVKGPSFGSLLRMPIQAAKAPVELPDEPLELSEEAFEDGDGSYGAPLYGAAEQPAGDAPAYDMPVAYEPAAVEAQPAYDEPALEEAALETEELEDQTDDFEADDFAADGGFGLKLGPVGVYWAVPLSARADGINFFVRLGNRL